MTIATKKNTTLLEGTCNIKKNKVNDVKDINNGSPQKLESTNKGPLRFSILWIDRFQYSSFIFVWIVHLYSAREYTPKCTKSVF